MRMAIDCRYVRERPSGIGTYVQALASLVPPRATDTEFQLWRHRRAPARLSRAPNVIELRVSPEPNTLRTILYARAYAPLEHLDLFHGPHNLLPIGLTCPTVVTVHDTLWLEAPHLVDRRWRRLLKQLFMPRAMAFAIGRATRILTPSTATADAVGSIAPSSRPRLRVVPHGVDAAFTPATDSEAARAEASALIGSDETYLLVIGQNAPRKGHDVALRAFAQAAPAGVSLVFVQRQHGPAGLERLARELDVSSRVRWLPAMPQEQVAVLLRSSLALLQPSEHEGFGLPVLEAMACGCPVIASGIPALAEVLGGAGMLVPPSDVRALAAAIRSLAGEPSKRVDMRLLGLERARQFTWERCAAETLAVYREAAEGR